MKKIVGSILHSDDYVDEHGLICPACRQMDTISTGHPFDLGLGKIGQECRCEFCSAMWTDNYTLTGYTDLVQAE